MKYIVVELDGKEQIFTFPKSVDHDRMLEAVGAIRMGSDTNWRRQYRGAGLVSAGFVDGGVCHGRSETLGMASRGVADTALLADALAATATIQPVAAPEPVRELRGMLTGGKPGPLAWVRLQYPNDPTTNWATMEAWLESGWTVIALDTAAPAQAATDAVRDAVLVEAAQAVARALPSESDSIAVESAIAAVLALRTTSTAAQAATPADSQKGDGDGA